MSVFDPDKYLKILKENIIELARLSQSINKKESSDISKYIEYIELKEKCKRHFIESFYASKAIYI